MSLPPPKCSNICVSLLLWIALALWKLWHHHHLECESQNWKHQWMLVVFHSHLSTSHGYHLSPSMDQTFSATQLLTLHSAFVIDVVFWVWSLFCYDFQIGNTTNMHHTPCRRCIYIISDIFGLYSYSLFAVIFSGGSNTSIGLYDTNCGNLFPPTWLVYRVWHTSKYKNMTTF